MLFKIDFKLVMFSSRIFFCDAMLPKRLTGENIMYKMVPVTETSNIMAEAPFFHLWIVGSLMIPKKPLEFLKGTIGMAVSC